ncbi:hypothetical protein AAU61_07555 [Desulfocarbo indianensis]|nr:hypothetical protein AAU61_07555 [Desulfocarbo indianensis]
MQNIFELARCGLCPSPAQTAAGKQGVRHTRAAGAAKATARPERSQQHGVPAAGAAGRTALMEYAG